MSLNLKTKFGQSYFCEIILRYRRLFILQGLNEALMFLEY